MPSPPDCFLCNSDPQGGKCDGCGRPTCASCLERCTNCGKDVCMRGMYDKSMCEDCAEEKGRDIWAARAS